MNFPSMFELMSDLKGEGFLMSGVCVCVCVCVCVSVCMYVCVLCVCVCLYVFVYVCGVSVWYGWVFCQPFEQHFVFGKAWGRATARGTEGTTSNAALCVQRLLYTKVTRREGSEECQA